MRCCASCRARRGCRSRSAIATWCAARGVSTAPIRARTAPTAISAASDVSPRASGSSSSRAPDWSPRPIWRSRQIAELRDLLAREWRGRGPLIWAGDINARGDLERFGLQEASLPGELAHRYCVDNPGHCAVESSWDNDAPWLDTQDLQGFLDGEWVRIKPVSIAARFDAPVDGRMLSDHDALEVRWRLSWRPVSSEAELGATGTVAGSDR